MSESIHPTAIINPKAQLGMDVTIGPYAVLEGDVVIGNNTSIGPHTYVADGARIGNHCTIHNGTVVATLPQDLKFKGEQTTFEIGDNTTVREFCTLNRGTTEHMKSTIGSNCFLMAYAHVAHDCTVGNNVILANTVQMGGHVEIGDWAILGGLTAVHQFSKIGAHAMIGGGFRIVKDVPPYILAGGSPLMFEGLNIVGLRRRGFSRETIDALLNAYHLMYLSKLNVSQAVEKIRAEVDITPEIRNVLDFIAASKRGIITARSRQ
ncbi:MAG: acyl-ACP--UDP-N-acetylglucosamine O-acyltransferase [Ignavibacteriales bacterium]|nr:acyl-ACP--UDP-N-acetylglucosamine O-acyltransferase [Ignavibacteriales bacterium]